MKVGRRRQVGVWRSVFALISIALVWPAAAQEAPLEYDVKAAFLLNFTKFIDWPASAFASGAPFRICITGEDPFGVSLAKIVEGEQVSSRPIAVEKMGREQLTHCQIVFFGRSEKNVAEAISRLGPGVLTVGESPDFLRAGGVIRFVVENNHVRFDVNQTTARKAGLEISSRLLKVARNVEGGA